MTGEGNRPIRLGRDLWVLFGRYAGWRGRSAVLRAYIEWYTWQPGAVYPQRPRKEDVMTDRDPIRGHVVGSFEIDDDSTPTVRTEPTARMIKALDDDQLMHGVKKKGKK